jgi:hypothetical protein
VRYTVIAALAWCTGLGVVALTGSPWWTLGVLAAWGAVVTAVWLTERVPARPAPREPQGHVKVLGRCQRQDP